MDVLRGANVSRGTMGTGLSPARGSPPRVGGSGMGHHGGATATGTALPCPSCPHGHEGKAVATRQLWLESIHFAPAELHDMDCKIWPKGF